MHIDSTAVPGLFYNYRVPGGPSLLRFGYAVENKLCIQTNVGSIETLSNNSIGVAVCICLGPLSGIAINFAWPKCQI